jgi:DNA-binding NarL/FixJ family response regulator
MGAKLHSEGRSIVADVRVLVVASDPLARGGLTAFVREQDDLLLVAQSNGGSDLPDLVQASRPDVLLWDLGWEPDGELIRLAEFTEQGPAVVALLPEDGGVARARAAGALGLLMREVDSGVLSLALHAAARGLFVQSQELLEDQPSLAPEPAIALVEELTSREREVLDLLAEGLTNRGIAQRLAISPLTVKSHVDAILGKLGAQGRTEAVVRAARMGLISL